MGWRFLLTFGEPSGAEEFGPGLDARSAGEFRRCWV